MFTDVHCTQPLKLTAASGSFSSAANLGGTEEPGRVSTSKKRRKAKGASVRLASRKESGAGDVYAIYASLC